MGAALRGGESMQLNSRFPFWPRREHRSSPGEPCPRWERALYLSISGDLPESTARAFDRHLLTCRACREEFLRARELRERCATVSSAVSSPPGPPEGAVVFSRPGAPERPSIWPAVREAIRRPCP